MILTGDFNVTPDNPALDDLNKIMKSARLHAEKTDTLASFNGWQKPISTAALGDNLKANGYGGLTRLHLLLKLLVMHRIRDDKKRV